ncbi:DUF6461 domain-containing protein [Microbispora bryophytorum]|uniref:DUF6461 domain-containing protein n=1 Tax=Microbispora bryophytorum TaxID=1460882 RepID=UPI0033CF83E4
MTSPTPSTVSSSPVSIRAGPGTRWGAAPDRLNRHLRELGIDPASDDWIDNAIPAVLALTGRISGVVVTPAHVERPVLGAALFR